MPKQIITDTEELKDLFWESAYWDMYGHSVNAEGFWSELYDAGDRTVELLYLLEDTSFPCEAYIYTD